MPILRTWSTRFASFLPSWLTDGWDADDPDEVSDGAKNHATLTKIVDSFIERARQGTQARFPSLGPPSALKLIGDDRGILQGRSESDAQFAARLIGWRYPLGHRVRGGAWALLEQVSIYFDRSRAYTIDQRATKFERTETTPGGTFDETFSALENFYPDGLDPMGRRAFWLFLEPRTGTAAPEVEFGDAGLWEGDGCVGLTGYVPDDFRALRRILRGANPWKPAGVRAMWLIVLLDGQDHTDVLVDGELRYWSVDDAGTRRPARHDGWRYVCLTPEIVNAYAGDADRTYPTAVQLPGGSDYTGDPDNYPASVTLPSGAVYSGNPNNYPDSVLLIDDGDQPLAL